MTHSRNFECRDNGTGCAAESDKPLLSPRDTRDENGELFLTGLVETSLPSADPHNKACLQLTGLDRTYKSYAKDLSPPMVKLQDVS